MRTAFEFSTLPSQEPQKEPDYYCDKQHCGDTELAGFAHSRDTPLDCFV